MSFAPLFSLKRVPISIPRNVGKDASAPCRAKLLNHGRYLIYNAPRSVAFNKVIQMVRHVR
jgi:hypothetical protein